MFLPPLVQVYPGLRKSEAALGSGLWALAHHPASLTAACLSRLLPAAGCPLPAAVHSLFSLSKKNGSQRKETSEIKASTNASKHTVNINSGSAESSGRGRERGIRQPDCSFASAILEELCLLVKFLQNCCLVLRVHLAINTVK